MRRFIEAWRNGGGARRSRFAGLALFAAALALSARPWPAAGADAAPAEDLTAALAAGRAALADGLPAVAQRQLEAALRQAEAAGAEPKRAEEAVVLLLRSMREQNRAADILRFLDVGGAWVNQAAGRDGVAFWRALAEYELKQYAAALKDLDGFEKRYPSSAWQPRVERVRAWCQLKEGRLPEALAAFARFDELFRSAPEYADNLLDWGKALLAGGHGAAGREVLMRLVRLTPAPPAAREGRYWLGLALADADQADEAIDMLTTLANDTAASDDLRGGAWIGMGTAHEKAGRKTEAIGALRTGLGLARRPDLKRDGGFALGRLLVDGGSLEDGVPLLKSLIVQYPADPRADAGALAVAEALLAGGRDADAVEEFQHYIEAFANTNGQAQAQFGKGTALARLARHAEAATAFGKALVLHADPTLKAQSLQRVGESHLANGQYKPAQESFERLLAEFPTATVVPAALFHLGECLSHADDTARAEEVFTRLVERYPASRYGEEALFRVAEIREKQGAWNAAIESYGRLMQTYTNGTLCADALLGRGMARYRLFAFGDALRDFDRILREFPAAGAAEQAEFRRGLCFYGMGRDREAVAVFRGFAERYPTSAWLPDVQFWLGKHGFNQGDYAAAEHDFALLATNAAKHALADEALLWAGLAASRQKEYVRANEYFKQLAKDYPDSAKMADARFAQGEALSELASYAEAILVFDEVIKKYPESGLVSAAWLRRGDCQFVMGAQDPARYQESLDSYRAVAASATAETALQLQAEYKIGRSLEKMSRTDDALDQYYVRVVVRFLKDVAKGAWPTEDAKLWFTRAAFNAADILEARKDWRGAVNVLERVEGAGVPASNEATERVRKIKTDHWLL